VKQTYAKKASYVDIQKFTINYSYTGPQPIHAGTIQAKQFIVYRQQSLLLNRSDVY